MKKILSLILALLILMSISGCTPDMGSVDVLQQQTTIPETTVSVVPEKAVILNLLGRHIDELPETDNFVVEVIGEEHSEQPAGTVIRQEPECGAWEDKGTTVSVVISLGPSTQIQETQPPEQDREYPDRPSQNPTQPEYTEPEPTQPQPTEPEATQPRPTEPEPTEPQPYLDPNGSYTSKDDVALYIHLYGRLPNNFITKSQAKSMYGKTNGLNKYGKCIGGDRFYNNEGLLPNGYTYYECDIDTLYSSKRGAKRLVFTYSGRIYYTSDHYESFVRLY